MPFPIHRMADGTPHPGSVSQETAGWTNTVLVRRSRHAQILHTIPQASRGALARPVLTPFDVQLSLEKFETSPLPVYVAKLTAAARPIGTGSRVSSFDLPRPRVFCVAIHP